VDDLSGGDHGEDPAEQRLRRAAKADTRPTHRAIDAELVLDAPHRVKPRLRLPHLSALRAAIRG
jgi:hypothetical protein